MPVKRTDKSTAHSLFSGIHQSSENELATKLSNAAGSTMENSLQQNAGKKKRQAGIYVVRVYLRVVQSRHIQTIHYLGIYT